MSESFSSESTSSSSESSPEDDDDDDDDDGSTKSDIKTYVLRSKQVSRQARTSERMRKAGEKGNWHARDVKMSRRRKSPGAPGLGIVLGLGLARVLPRASSQVSLSFFSSTIYRYKVQRCRAVTSLSYSPRACNARSRRSSSQGGGDYGAHRRASPRESDSRFQITRGRTPPSSGD